MPYAPMRACADADASLDSAEPAWVRVAVEGGRVDVGCGVSVITTVDVGSLGHPATTTSRSEERTMQRAPRHASLAKQPLPHARTEQRNWVARAERQRGRERRVRCGVVTELVVEGPGLNGVCACACACVCVCLCALLDF
jgi:hypothetical protein